MVLPGHVELVQGQVEHSGPEALVAEAVSSHQAVGVITHRPSRLRWQHWVAERRDGPSVDHVGLGLNDRCDGQVMVMVVVMVAHCSKLKV